VEMGVGEGSRERMERIKKIAFHLACEEVQPIRSKHNHKSSSTISNKFCAFTTSHKLEAKIDSTTNTKLQ